MARKPGPGTNPSPAGRIRLFSFAPRMDRRVSRGYLPMTVESSGRGVGRAREPEDGPPTLEVFWRPGCPYCSVLRRQLERRQVPSTWRNIFDDPVAGDAVRAANSGNETVPTVRVGPQTLTNPSWRQLAPLLGGGGGNRCPRRARACG